MVSSSCSLLRVLRDKSSVAITELEDLPDVFNDFDVDFSENPRAADEYIRDQRSRRNIRDATKRLQVNLMNPLREGKKLLVLDIDYSKFGIHGQFSF